MSQADDERRPIVLHTTERDPLPGGVVDERWARPTREVRNVTPTDHLCPVCEHDCTQLERDFTSFVQTGEWHPDAVRGTPIDSQLPASFVREIEATGARVGVKGNEPAPSKLAAELRQLANLVEREGAMRHNEQLRRLGLATARVMGPRWSQRRRMLEGHDEPPT